MPGFVELDKLLDVPMLSRYTANEVLEEVQSSQSHRGNSRFDSRKEGEKTLVRASYGRKLEKVYQALDQNEFLCLNSTGKHSSLIDPF